MHQQVTYIAVASASVTFALYIIAIAETISSFLLHVLLLEQREYSRPDPCNACPRDYSRHSGSREPKQAVDAPADEHVRGAARVFGASTRR